MSAGYESLVFDAIPPRCERALDVGCGNGALTRELRKSGIPKVVGIDQDVPCIQRCKNHPEADDISYIVGDLLTCSLESNGFDLVTAVASLHHMDARRGLTRLRQLVMRGGVLVIIGLARSDMPKDIPIEVAAQIVGRLRSKPRQSGFMQEAPIVWPPPETYATMRRLSEELLPGARWRRHLLWRYSLVWTSP